MIYAENFIKWMNLTVEIIIQRLEENEHAKVSTDYFANAVKNHFQFTDNTEFHDLIYKRGLMLYDDIKHLFQENI